MQLKKEDMTGLGVSVGLHVVVLILLSMLTAAASDKQQMGFLEVEFGPVAEGRPVRQAPVLDEPEPEPEEEAREEVEQTPVAPPEEIKPVDLPDTDLQAPAEEVIDAPEAEVIAPQQSNTEEEKIEEEPEPEQEVVKPLGSGALTPDEGSETGEEGESNEDVASAPYQIEGLNRSPVSTPIPQYSSQVNALIRVRITVDPQGRIIQRFPLIKGDPNLEREVMNALLRWRFNPLPAEAPRENQTGVVSFRFRLQ